MNKISSLSFCFAIRLLFIVLFMSAAEYAMAAHIYTLGPGDEIKITVYAGGEEQVDVSMNVSEQGVINAPFVGSTKAAGLTTSELEKRLHDQLGKDYFVDPQVIVQVLGYHSLKYSISGAVKNPGNYEMQSKTTIMELIAKAGGVSSERGNVAYILRSENDTEKNKPIKVNLIKLLDEGDMTSNVLLKSGDAVYIPLAKGLEQSESKVYVAGMVKKPGLQDFQPGLTALSVCLMAGGFDKFAAPNRTTVVRSNNGSEEPQVIKVNLEDVIEGKSPDFPLEPGDRLYVPESWL